ncbi:UDP-N-acetylmuramate:L-alanyl-gamma-D-glutamyl-meso-diaminopimelate ligase [Lacimicrobium alkaliphilum]|uniref:UDP-N-acetylmuramate--L-alanyl-gamma-D-glutamyl-meso-2,6-diaminoheptandioate ligase n=1 Tax=Lacimicrobium alkaliphilum TaxID=1526571 RepID=A0ABQ1R8Z6_9ALTE|nr:UDP-N-acetylmuramate:L-alanyl-gamma-D-glutamyl-meso-diaminopimelate ligase [Lacimicrobium alkaliphilum]GGD62472.1 UDP-N-acetylmuramate--L-alanyl-gamma-D-glutamyl-meso-2,6-diaminoheptandioate ligase [Lacimicrobium alkaliphilum]
MHIHILGICGTFMGGIAALAKAMGHQVSGSDANVYPPMSTQLQKLDIPLTQGFGSAQLKPEPDLVVIGNALSRGNPAVEAVLNRNIPYTSGPQWLLDNLLKDRWVLAVAGTHGKTTTASMLAWILESAGLQPGFLIGGIPENFSISARLGQSPFFVIEADEYDSAFFDKRSKFVHYRPRTLILNNLEFDHADIFADLAAIQTQFHHLLRMVPGNGRIITPARDENLEQVLKMGVWSETEKTHQQWNIANSARDGCSFEVVLNDEIQGRICWSLMGQYNQHNALMAVAAARHAGVRPADAVAALNEFKNVQRRMQLKALVADISIYDDFAHHPTAIAATVQGLRSKVGASRILAVLEPRSNTMKQGVHKDRLATSWEQADLVYIYEPDGLNWSVDEVKQNSVVPLSSFQVLDNLISALVNQAQPGDHILIMSNGGFGGIHQKLQQALERKHGV